MVLAPKTTSTGIVGLYQSPIGKKLLTGVTGIALMLFVVVHLLGNLTLFFSASGYNQLAYVIESVGPLTAVIELMLLAIALLHATLGLKIYIGKLKARPVGYSVPISNTDNTELASRESLSARTMIFSGVVLAIFLVFHLLTFKFGPYYSLPESSHRDLARLVFETFHKPGYTAGYVLVMSVLGLHLRHGFWSALQSVGIATKAGLYAASAVIGCVITVGFIGLPLAIYFGFIG